MLEPEKLNGESQDMAAVKWAEFRQIFPLLARRLILLKPEKWKLRVRNVLFTNDLLFYRNRKIWSLSAGKLFEVSSTSKVWFDVNGLYCGR